MDRYAKRYELKDKAKDFLDGNYTPLIGGILLFFVILIMVTAMTSIIEAMVQVSGSAQALYITQLLTGALAQICMNFMTFGFAFVCLKIACRQHVFFADLFYGFHPDVFRKALLIALCKYIANKVCFLGSDLLSGNFHWAPGESLDLLQLLYILIALLIGFMIYIPIALTLDLSNYLALDFPEKQSGMEIIKDSFRVIKGHRKRFLYLQLSFIPLDLLAYLTFGIGYLWLMPYEQMTFALFYLDLMHPAKKEDTF